MDRPVVPLAPHGPLVGRIDRGEYGNPFLDYLDTVRSEVNGRARLHLSRLAGNGDPGVADHLLSGKRLRAGLTMLVYDSFADDGPRREEALDLAAAIELAHSVSLILDDMLDGDDTRRGKRAPHMLLGHKKTVLAVTGLLSVPYSIVAQRGLVYVEELSEAQRSMVRGAEDELDAAGDGDLGARYERIIADKTGTLFSLGAQFGARAAGCREDVVGLMADYGSRVGKAMQVADDIADLRRSLRAGERPRQGSEALLYRHMGDGDDPRSTPSGPLDARLEEALRDKVREAQLSVRKLMVEKDLGVACKERLRGRVPHLLSAPREIADLLLSQGGPSDPK